MAYMCQRDGEYDNQLFLIYITQSIRHCTDKEFSICLGKLRRKEVYYTSSAFQLHSVFNGRGAVKPSKAKAKGGLDSEEGKYLHH